MTASPLAMIVSKELSVATCQVQGTAAASPLPGKTRVHRITRSAHGSPLAMPWVKWAAAGLSMAKPRSDSAPSEAPVAWRKERRRRDVGIRALSNDCHVGRIMEQFYD